MKAGAFPEPTLDDYRLADRYEYPVAVPEAIPYRIAISIHCMFCGKLRPAGSVMLFHPRHTKNKMEYLDPV